MSEHVAERKDKQRQVKLADIIIGERFRIDYGDIEELVNSVKEKGIIQPITLDSNLNILAGGRRYTAAGRAGLKTIPCIIREYVDEVDSREIELIENIHRKDFTWQERAKLTRQIDELYKKKDIKWSGRKTAELLDKGVGDISRQLQLAKAIEIIPELGTYETASEAMKVLKKMEGDAISQELADRQKARVTGPAEAGAGKDVMTKGIQDALRVATNDYKISDCFAGMAKLRDHGHIELIECDPPYGIDLNSQKSSKDSIGSTVTGYEEIDAEIYPGFLKKLCAEMFRVAGKDCWLIFWYGPTWHEQVRTALLEGGWQVDPIPALWTKYMGQTLQPELYLARAYEPFFIARKGKPVINKRGRMNVFNFMSEPPAAKYHPTQRPIQLIKEILDTFLVGTQNILVPFLGSGTTLRAAYFLGHRAFGFDLDGKYKDKFLLKVEDDSRKLLEGDKMVGLN